MPVNWEDLAAGGEGAVNELLFGLPEFVAKKVGDKQAIEDWIAKHKSAHDIGSTAGTIGSIFLPVPGLGAARAVGLAGKGAKAALAAAKGAEELSKGAKLLKGAEEIGRLAGKGAIAGGIESGVRGITSEKKPEDIIKDIQSGAAFGGAGGAIGGLIGKAAPRLTGEAAKTAEQAYLGTTDLTRRQAIGYLRDMAGPGAKGIKRLETVDDARKELVRVAKEIGAETPGKMDDAIRAHAAKWDAIDNAVESVAPNIRGSDLYTSALKNLDMNALNKAYGEDVVSSFLDKILKDGTQVSGLANSRQFLSDVFESSYSRGGKMTREDVALQRMQRTIASQLRKGVDEFAMDTAKKAGLDIDFNKLKRDYLPMRAIAESGAIADIAPLRISGGSPTAEKIASQEILGKLGMGGIGGAAGLATGNPEEDWQSRAMRGLAGAATGALASKALGRTLTKGIATSLPAVTAAEKLAGKISPEALATGGALVGGGAGALVAPKAVAEAAPKTDAEQGAAETGASAGSGDTPAYMNRIMDRIRTYAASQGVSEDSDEYKQFLSQVYSVTNGFAPDQVAGILYQDEGERAAYLKALKASRRLSEVLPKATTAKPGLFQGESEEASMARNAAVDQLAELVGNVAKERGSEKAAKAALNKILSGGETPERKGELISMLLAQYGVDIDALREMGIV